MTLATVDLTVIDELNARRRRRYERSRKFHRQDHPRASSIGPCAREMAIAIEHWDKREPPDVELLQRFGVGTDTEHYVIRELTLDGWDMVEQQLPFEIKETLHSRACWVDGKPYLYIDADRQIPVPKEPVIICTGHADGRLVHNDAKPVYETKSLNVNVWSRIDTARDFWTMGSFWRRYPLQLCMYLYAHNEPLGIFILHDCLGHLKFIPILLDDWLEETEAALQRCRQAAIAKLTGEQPDFHDDPTVCAKCWARSAGLCTPPMDFSGDATKVIDDPELAADLDRMHELKDGRDEYQGLDRRLKDRMRAVGAGAFVAGDFAINVTEKPRKTYAVPKDVKDQYATDGVATYTTWERLGAPNGTERGS